jgi:Tfp pilus assembly protein PilF
MSVIIDALEAARREKSRRESHGARSSVAPVLVPLRAAPTSGMRWAGMNGSRVIAFSAVAVLVVAATAVALVTSPSKSSLPTVPPLTSTILSEALADSGNRSPRPVPQATIPVTREPARPLSTASPAPRNPAQVAALPEQVTAPQRDTAAILQGQARTPAINASTPSVPESRPNGRLRIAVEQPRQPEAARLFSEAVAAHRAGDMPGARKLYDSVLVLTPRDGDALNNLGVLLSAQREYGRALDLLRRAAATTPKNAGVWNNIGTVFHEQGKNNDAIAAFRHALTIDPQHPGAKVGLAQQYLAISALGQAKDLLEEVVAAHPQLPEAHYTLGQVLELQGDRAGAIRAYGAFIKAAPARLASHVELVRRRVDALSRGS